MSRRDLDKQIAVSTVLTPRTNAVAGSGSVVDRSGFEQAAWVIVRGVAADADPSAVSASVLHSADGVAWSVPSTETDLTSGSQFTITSNSRTEELGYFGSKRYLTAVVSASSAASNSQSYAISVIKASPRHSDDA